MRGAELWDGGGEGEGEGEEGVVEVSEGGDEEEIVVGRWLTISDSESGDAQCKAF